MSRRASRNVKYAESEDSEEDFAASSRGSSRRKRAAKRDEEDEEDEDAFEAQDAGGGSEAEEGGMEEEVEDDESGAGAEDGSEAGDGGDDSEEDGEPSAKRRRKTSSRAGRKSAAKPAKKAAVKKEPKRRAAKPKRASGGGADAANKKMKALSVQQQLDMVMRAYKWWEAEELPEGKRWRSLVHNGIMFPPSYERHNVKMLYDGQPVELTAKQEEVATFYAQIAPDGPQLGNEETAETFNANFFKDFQAVLGKDHVIKDFAKCDFTPIRSHLETMRDAKKQMTKEEKTAEKEARAQQARQHQYALVDGHVQKVGNVTVEPPGLFRGRGVHPKMGVVKERVMPGSITISISEDAVPARCPVPGHAWKDVVHRDDATWLAYWNENVMNGTKYVFLAASSGFKGKSDLTKYEKARKLCKYIDKIRSDYIRNLDARELEQSQLATAMWVIDKLALRVGNEKDEDEADTVGACSLRLEHITFQEPCAIELDFLGKDSMRHHQHIDLSTYSPVGEKVYRNLKRFCSKKPAKAEIFDLLTVDMLNKHLSSLMPGLSGKVFRTYNASVTLEQQLSEHAEEIKAAATSQEQKRVYDAANREVAILCNHQRTVPKTHAAQVEKLQAKLDQLEEQLTELQTMQKAVKRGKQVKTKKAREEGEEVTREERAKESHLFARQPSAEQISNKISQWHKKIATTSSQLLHKEENATVALGTSKINYMDPRISVAWCKANEVPVERIFPATLRDKFSWAMSVNSGWRFPPE